jgi:hypothetical protein
MMLLYFSDETGDPGAGQGSSVHFGVCLLRVEPMEARRLAEAMQQVRRDLGLKPSHEFKWSRNRPATRLAALYACSQLSFAYRVRLWTKSSARLFGVRGKELEVELIRSCLRDFGPPWLPAKLVVDGLANRERAARIRKGLASSLDPHGRPCIQTVRLQDSASSDHLQLADLIAGWSATQILADAVARDIRQALSLRGTCLPWP